MTEISLGYVTPCIDASTDSNNDLQRAARVGLLFEQGQRSGNEQT